MTTREDARRTVLSLVAPHASKYALRWADQWTAAGDFEGRDFTLEVFNVPVRDQRPLRRRLRDVIRHAEVVLGAPLMLIFHTPEATTRHYAFVIAGRIENAQLVAPLQLKASGELSARSRRRSDHRSRCGYPARHE